MVRHIPAGWWAGGAAEPLGNVFLLKKNSLEEGGIAQSSGWVGDGRVCSEFSSNLTAQLQNLLLELLEEILN